MDSGRRMTFGVRGMLGAVAVAAVLCAVVFTWGRLAYRRSRIDAILREQVRRYNPFAGFLTGTTPWPTRLKGAKLDDYERLRADPEAVARRLLLTIERGDTTPSADTRSSPVAASLILLGEWIDEADSVALARGARDRLLGSLLDGKLPDAVESQAIGLVESLDGRLGPDQSRRAAIRDRVRSLAGRPDRALALRSWASVAGSIGGREEVELLLDLARGPDEARFEAAAMSGLRATRWPGIFPGLGRLAAPPPPGRVALGVALRAWAVAARLLRTPAGEIDFLAYANDGPDPATFTPWTFQHQTTVWTALAQKALPLARRARPDRLALGMPIMLATARGRAFLLAYAEDSGNPPQLRRKAIHMLKRNAEGIRLLLDVCDDPARRPTVARFFGQDNTNLVGGYGGDVLDPNQWPVDQHWKGANAADSADPRPELHALLEYRTEGPNLHFADYVGDLDVPARTQLLIRSGVPEAAAGDVARALAERARHLLRTFVPPPHPEAPGDWVHRLKSVSGPIPWDAYLDALARYPDTLGRRPWGGYSTHADRLGFFLGYQLTLPPGAEPILLRMARNRPEAYDAEPLKALFIQGGRWEEAPLVFDLMESRLRRDPDRLSARDPGLLRTLVRRFAVNFGWDVDAWRAWWDREGRAEAEAEAGRSS